MDIIHEALEVRRGKRVPRASRIFGLGLYSNFFCRACLFGSYYVLHIIIMPHRASVHGYAKHYAVT